MRLRLNWCMIIDTLEPTQRVQETRGRKSRYFTPVIIPTTLLIYLCESCGGLYLILVTLTIKINESSVSTTLLIYSVVRVRCDRPPIGGDIRSRTVRFWCEKFSNVRLPPLCKDNSEILILKSITITDTFISNDTLSLFK